MRILTIANRPFLPGVVALAASLRANSGVDWPLECLCDEGLSPDEVLAAGADEAYPLCERLGVDAVPSLPHTPRRYLRAVSKLLLWRYPTAEALLYLDADCLCLGPLGELADVEPTAMVPDWGFRPPRRLGPRRDFEAVNTGVIVLRPDPDLSDAMMCHARRTTSASWLGDQGVINDFFRINPGLPFRRLPHVFNTLKRVPVLHPGRVPSRDIRILHFVGVKPWNAGGDPDPRYRRLERLWRSYHDLGRRPAAAAAPPGGLD